MNAVGDATTTQGYRGDTYGEFVQGSVNVPANVAGHALVGCASSAAGGGSCRSGALSGAFGAAMSNSGFYVKGNMVVSTIQHAIVGGIGSVLGGGKFGNGAVTAAFGYLYNEVRHTDNRGYDPNEVNRLTYDDSVEIWRQNSDFSLVISVDSLNLKVIVIGVWEPRVYDAIVIGAEDYAVHGRITIDTVSGNFHIREERYNFEQHSGSDPLTMSRNDATFYGFQYVSKLGTIAGTDYTIRFRGSPAVYDPLSLVPKASK
jgi:hypothetical protein